MKKINLTKLLKNNNMIKYNKYKIYLQKNNIFIKKVNKILIMHKLKKN